MSKVIVRKRSPIERVERLLSKIKLPRCKRGAINSEPVESVTMGQVNQPFHKFKGHSKFTEEHPELWLALQEMIKFIDPNHYWTSITINHNVLCKPHRDARNDGTTLIIGLGNYTGGELSVSGQIIDINHKPYYFNGYLHEHYTLPFEGDRWSLMFYSIRKSWDINHRQSDIPIIREVYHGNQYHCKDIGFGIEINDLWLDVGAHIGCWSKKCHYYGATTISYEPNPDNYALLVSNASGPCHNVAVCAKASDSFVHGDGYFSYIDSTVSDTPVNCVTFESIIVPDCCVKMDIEGSEMDILDHCDFTGIKKLVLAYHIKADHSRSNFLRRMDRLRQWFSVVHYQPIKDEHMPNEIIVYAMTKSA